MKSYLDWLILCVIPAIVLCLPAVSIAQGGFLAVPLPEMNGPLPVSPESYPQMAANRIQTPVDLASYGYVEEEFLVSGKANVYDWDRDGSVSIRTADAPYLTRILVRRPVQAENFSGNVIVETVNNARNYDWAFIWALSHDYFMNRGDAFVALTHNPEGIEALKKFDPVRYATLSFANPGLGEVCGEDNAGSASEAGLKWDVISQVGALLRSDNGPLAGFDVERLYASTHTRELTTYANSVHKIARLADGKPVYNGFVIKSEYAPADAIRRCAQAPGEGDPRRIVRNAGVPVIRVTAQGDVPATRYVRREDNDRGGDRYRLWEVAGAPHMDRIYYRHMPLVEDQQKAGQTGFLANWPMAYACTPDIDLMDFPVMRYAVNNAFAAIDRWVRQDMPPPRAERIGLSSETGEGVPFLTDEYGNAVGGMRNVYLDVPVATYYANSPGPAVCRNLGRKKLFSWPRLERIYGNPGNYAEQVKDAVKRQVAEGWLVQDDGEKILDELISEFP